jgi:hypothetical protein
MAQEQKVVEQTGFVGVCTCGWKGNLSVSAEDAQQHADEHGAWHAAQEDEAAAAETGEA